MNKINTFQPKVEYAQFVCRFQQILTFNSKKNMLSVFAQIQTKSPTVIPKKTIDSSFPGISRNSIWEFTGHDCHNLYAAKRIENGEEAEEGSKLATHIFDILAVKVYAEGQWSHRIF
jgi:hypothetical protein